MKIYAGGFAILLFSMFVLTACSKEEVVETEEGWIGKRLTLSHVMEEEIQGGEVVGTERIDYAADAENFIEFKEDRTYYFQFSKNGSEELIGESGTYDLQSGTMTIEGLPNDGFTFDYVDGYLIVYAESSSSAFRESLHWR